MNGSRSSLLGALESELMDLFWSGQDGNIKSIHAVLSQRRRIAPGTVQSTLSRLVEKGFLERDKLDGTWFYRARMSRDQFRGLLRRISF